MVSGEMGPDFNVLGSFVEHRIFRHRDAGLIVLKDGDGARAKIEITQQLAFPNRFFGGFSKGCVLRFGGELIHDHRDNVFLVVDDFPVKYYSLDFFNSASFRCPPYIPQGPWQALIQTTLQHSPFF